MKNRIISLLFAAVFVCLTLAGCQSTTPASSSDKVQVVATIFPPYDFVREIAGDHVDLTMLLSPGAESHSYDPSPQDIITIQNCDVFIYVGGDSDDWVDQILDSMDTSEMTIVSMMELVETVEEEIVEGMEGDHSHGTSDFEDGQVEDRALSDWAGDWQSVYPYLMDGTLDQVMEHKAAEDEAMSRQDYDAYYKAGYETDVERVVITDNTMEFYVNGTASKAEYEYQGYEILTYESGGKGVRYQFEATGETNGAPRYIQFSDHLIAPEESEHFHLYFGDDGFDALLEETDNWPTYYPSDLDGDGIADDMLAHDDEDGDDHGDEDTELDEHVWTSPKNAQTIVTYLSDLLCELDADNADAYQSNTEAYLRALSGLDDAFREVVDNAARRTVIFGDRFPFRYFADEYGLTYYAAFPGCSTETEASAATIKFLIDKVNEESIPVVFYIEFSNEKMADTICGETDATKMQLHSCHNVTKDDFEAGASYLSLMQQNVENLKEALQ
ncbi:MAG: ZinT/AdcA family metal-binding protein [Clostridiales bacterium]|nr:ZinT/AdcA family metal-binding protein [Clostridiales bacterium]